MKPNQIGFVIWVAVTAFIVALIAVGILQFALIPGYEFGVVSRGLLISTLFALLGFIGSLFLLVWGHVLPPYKWIPKRSQLIVLSGSCAIAFFVFAVLGILATGQAVMFP